MMLKQYKEKEIVSSLHRGVIEFILLPWCCVQDCNKDVSVWFHSALTLSHSDVPFLKFHGVISRVKVTNMDQGGHLEGPDTQDDSSFLMPLC